jgi:hypothetical protein
MIIYHTINGVTTSRTVKILPSFSPDISYSFRFGNTTNGGYYSIDRGEESDYYTSEISFAGEASEIIGLHDWLIGPASPPKISITLENNEYIFGPNINIVSGYECAIIDYGDLKQRTSTTWGFTVRVACANVSHTSATPAIPATLYPSSSSTVVLTNGNSAQPNYDLNTVSGSIATFSTDNDRAVFSFDCEMPHGDAAGLLEYYCHVLRGGVLDASNVPTLSGFPNPFGESFTYPCDIRILSISGLEQYTPDRWRMNITIGRNP